MDGLEGVDVKLDGNKVADQLIGLLREGVKQARVNEAVVGNGTAALVKLSVYNYIDTSYLIAAQTVNVAPGHVGRVAASGDVFKIHINDNKDEEYTVAPGKAYRYDGLGAFSEVTS